MGKAQLKLDQEPTIDRPELFDLHRFQPRSKGGTDDMSNLAISHRFCNRQKGDSLAN